MRGSGYGSLALQLCVKHIYQYSGSLLWCNARESALGFYENLGFLVRGEPYDLPGHGKRYFLWRDL